MRQLYIELKRLQDSGQDPMVYTIALAGNPNCGKTTLFNALTGSNQHVGNYPGVTVEKKQGHFKVSSKQVRVIDLPGTYSLSYHSPEERIAQNELLSGEIQLVVVLVDAGTLSRGLVFVAQLMQLDLPMILCLNMWDEAQRSGQQIDVQAMQALLGIPIVTMVASKGQGLPELRKLIGDQMQSAAAPKKDTAFVRTADVGSDGDSDRDVVKDAEADTDMETGKVSTAQPTSTLILTSARLNLGAALTESIGQLQKLIPEQFSRHSHWVATKLLLGDAHYSEKISKDPGGERILAIANELRTHIEADARMDIQLYLTEHYYGFVDGLLREVMIRTKRQGARATSDKIDKVLVHPVFGLPFFLLIVYLLFEFTFRIGQYPMGWIEAGFGALTRGIEGTWPANQFGQLRSLVVDGIIGGVGGVLVFLPNILLLFLGISFLEDSGYMARSAFIMDKVMHRVGLHGRSFIPLITGFGCTVPGIMATRTIVGQRERLTTMLILPLMSCGARLPIWMLLVPVFFPESWRAPGMMGIYVFGVLLAMLLAFVLRKTLLKGEDEPFVMELPPYRLPTLRATITHMFERAYMYIKKAGTMILGVSIVLWFLMTYPKAPDVPPVIHADSTEQTAETDTTTNKGEIPTEMSVKKTKEQTQLAYSAAGRLGRAIEPVLEPMGLDWKIGTALIGTFAAKEVFVAQMGIIYSLGRADEESHDLRAAIARDYNRISGISLMLFLLIGTPCVATVAVMRKESGSWTWALLQFFGLTLIAFVLATIVYQLGSLFAG